MLTLKEARKTQKEREGKALAWFIASLVGTLLITYLLIEFTSLFETHSIFYLVPVLILGFAVKKTEIYKFASAKEFVGKVIYLNVYTVKEQRVKGERSYMMNYGLEVEMIVQSEDGRSKSLQIPAGPITNNIAEGTSLAILRFIDVPIIIND